jgi:hypothetical protein
LFEIFGEQLGKTREKKTGEALVIH